MGTDDVWLSPFGADDEQSSSIYLPVLPFCTGCLWPQTKLGTLLCLEPGSSMHPLGTGEKRNAETSLASDQLNQHLL